MSRPTKKMPDGSQLYRGVLITKLFPSGMHEYYCHLQKSFLKFDDIKACRESVRESLSKKKD